MSYNPVVPCPGAPPIPHTPLLILASPELSTHPFTKLFPSDSSEQPTSNPLLTHSTSASNSFSNPWPQSLGSHSLLLLQDNMDFLFQKESSLVCRLPFHLLNISSSAYGTSVLPLTGFQRLLTRPSRLHWWLQLSKFLCFLPPC